MTIVTLKLSPGLNKDGATLMKVQEMKLEALKDLLMLGGKVARCMDKIMLFNTTAITK